MLYYLKQKNNLFVRTPYRLPAGAVLLLVLFSSFVLTFLKMYINFYTLRQYILCANPQATLISGSHGGVQRRQLFPLSNGCPEALGA